MTKKLVLYLVTVFFFSVSCKNAEKKEKEHPNNEIITKVDPEETITFMLDSKSESNATGEASFTEKGKEVTFTARITGLVPGEHAIHIHEKADCSSPDGKSTGGHWNPTYTTHGKWGSKEGFHKGDIGNFTADSNGNGSITLTTDAWCIGCDDDTKNILGKALIVHAGADDFVTQPTGNAGGRVSCGGIIK